jgi:hypothetical protein
MLNTILSLQASTTTSDADYTKALSTSPPFDQLVTFYLSFAVFPWDLRAFLNGPTEPYLPGTIVPRKKARDSMGVTSIAGSINKMSFTRFDESRELC